MSKHTHELREASMETMHPQIPVTYGGQEAEVDEGIADLILALWRAGYRTGSSCQAFPAADGRAYVAFMTAGDAHRFAAIIGADVYGITEEERRRGSPSAGGWRDDAEALVAFWPSSIAEATRRVGAAATLRAQRHR